jgi:hypothetical protein
MVNCYLYCGALRLMMRTRKREHNCPNSWPPQLLKLPFPRIPDPYSALPRFHGQLPARLYNFPRGLLPDCQGRARFESHARPLRTLIPKRIPKWRPNLPLIPSRKPRVTLAKSQQSHDDPYIAGFTDWSMTKSYRQKKRSRRGATSTADMDGHRPAGRQVYSSQ